MSLETLYTVSLWILFVTSALTFPALFFVTAPYGRHIQQGWGPRMNATRGWLVMETPPLIVFPVVFLLSPHASATVPLMVFAWWLVHYSHRSIIFPLRMRVRAKQTPVAAVVMGVSFNLVNGFAIAYGVGHESPHLLDTGWLLDPRFLLGACLVVIGFAMNVHSDSILRNLRQPGETGYAIPRGGMFRWVSCPNYLGEITEWVGFALILWNPAGLAFAAFTVANLFPRALSHHRWYRDQFEDYPPDRKAIIPGLL